MAESILSKETVPRERHKGAAEAPTALLIGSWKCEPSRPIRLGATEAVENTITRKQGIKRVLRKFSGSYPSPDDWMEGDLNNMKQLMLRKGVEVFNVYKYEERNDDGVYSTGKNAVMAKMREFFEQEGKNDFILYFTGHGDQEGSWVIPVTTACRNKKRDKVDGVTPGSPSSIVSETLTTPSLREVCSDTSERAESCRARLKSDTPASVCSSAPSLSCMTPTLGGNVKLVSLYERARRLQPAPTKVWNDLITYEDVTQLWDSTKGERKQRRIMIILECCHSGRWVQKANGEIETKAMDLDKESIDVEIIKRHPCRPDISIQAACGPSETTSVSHNQLSSVFTRAFVAAQNRWGFEKMVLTLFDHLFVLNLVSIARSPEHHRFSPVRSLSEPFCGIRFFDSFDDMHLEL